MEHQVIEFFPSVCGVYQYPEDKINDIKLVCQKIRDTIKPGEENCNQNALSGDLFHYYNESNSSIYDFHPELEHHKKWALECATHFFTEVQPSLLEFLPYQSLKPTKVSSLLRFKGLLRPIF